MKKLFLVALASAVIATALRAWMRRSDDHGADPQPTGDDVQRWEDEGGAVADEEAQISVAL